MCVPGIPELGARANVSVFTVFGEGHHRLVQAKRSLISLSTVKHTCFDNFYLKVGPGTPGASWVSPGCLLDAYWVPLLIY